MQHLIELSQPKRAARFLQVGNLLAKDLGIAGVQGGDVNIRRSHHRLPSKYTNFILFRLGRNVRNSRDTEQAVLTTM